MDNLLARRLRRWGWGIGIATVVIVVVLALAGAYMLDYSLFPKMRHGHNLPWRLDNIISESPQLRPWADSLKHCHALHDTVVLMPTGERHHATYINASEPSRRVAVLVHGYRDNGMGMMHVASIYHHMGYNILLPDLHAHGKSEGEGVQMGWKDRLDVMRWMAVADSLWGGTEGTAMVLHGISMGAATVMCVSGERLPDYVKCFVEDCGYTSVWDEFEHELASQFHLPAFPLLYTTSLQCKLRYGWSFGEASPLRQVARCHKPMLFIRRPRHLCALCHDAAALRRQARTQADVDSAGLYTRHEFPRPSSGVCQEGETLRRPVHTLTGGATARRQIQPRMGQIQKQELVAHPPEDMQRVPVSAYGAAGLRPTMGYLTRYFPAVMVSSASDL